MTAKEQRFCDLASKLAPMESEAGKVKLEMMMLVTEMARDIVTEAFPTAQIVTIHPIVEIRPSDLARHAKEAVQSMKDQGISPELIVIDQARCTITLAKRV